MKTHVRLGLSAIVAFLMSVVVAVAVVVPVAVPVSVPVSVCQWLAGYGRPSAFV